MTPENFTTIAAAIIISIVVVIMLLAASEVINERFNKSPIGKRCKYRFAGKKYKGTVVRNEHTLLTIKSDKCVNRHIVWRSDVKPLLTLKNAQ